MSVNVCVEGRNCIAPTKKWLNKLSVAVVGFIIGYKDTHYWYTCWSKRACVCIEFVDHRSSARNPQLLLLNFYVVQSKLSMNMQDKLTRYFLGQVWTISHVFAGWRSRVLNVMSWVLWMYKHARSIFFFSRHMFGKDLRGCNYCVCGQHNIEWICGCAFLWCLPTRISNII